MKELFPSSSSQKVPDTFDPTKGCVFADRKGKRKAARVRPCHVNLILLCDMESRTPRGKQKQSLIANGRVKKIDFCRNMSSHVVKNTILRAFAGIEDFGSSYVLLHQGQDGRLSNADVQQPSGDTFVTEALNHRGNVYLRPGFEVCH